MRKTILYILGLLIVVGAIFGAKAIVDNKNKPKPRIDRVLKTVFVQDARNTIVPIAITGNGNLVAKRRIELYSEVQGVFKNTGKSFKGGENYRKGDVLVRLDASEYFATVQSAKSNLYNLITSIMPDLRLDYPDAFIKWQSYLSNFDMNRATPKMPEASSEQEKFFITGRNIYSTYYNLKNLEERLSKYTIRAPFSGVLTEALVTEGTLVRNGQKLGEFIDPSIYEIEVAVSAAYSDLLKVGEKVSLTNLEKTANYNGKVVRVNASLNQASQTVSAFVEVKDTTLKEGMYLEASLSAKEEKDAVEISRSLLQQGNQIFYVRNDTILDLMQVRPVYFSDKKVVLKGIPDGTVILSKPVPGAYAGMLVSIYEEANPGDTAKKSNPKE